MKEKIISFIFTILGLIAVALVLVITLYLLVAGIPAIREIGLFEFLFGRTWKSTGQDPQFGILPFILTSIYGTCGAMVIGLPIGFFASVCLAKMVPARIKDLFEVLIGVLSGIP